MHLCRGLHSEIMERKEKRGGRGTVWRWGGANRQKQIKTNCLVLSVFLPVWSVFCLSVFLPVSVTSEQKVRAQEILQFGKRRWKNPVSVWLCQFSVCFSLSVSSCFIPCFWLFLSLYPPACLPVFWCLVSVSVIVSCRFFSVFCLLFSVFWLFFSRFLPVFTRFCLFFLVFYLISACFIFSCFAFLSVSTCLFLFVPFFSVFCLFVSSFSDCFFRFLPVFHLFSVFFFLLFFLCFSAWFSSVFCLCFLIFLPVSACFSLFLSVSAVWGGLIVCNLRKPRL